MGAPDAWRSAAPWHRTMVPGLMQLRRYERPWLRGDALAGVTVAAYLIPQVMAYAGVAGLEPVVGLWAALPALALYAALGSSRQLSIGPESTTALMTATVIAPLAAGNATRYAALAAALALAVGLAAIVAWALRLGFVADLLSQPILVGYLAGVAVIMMIGQLEKTTGVPVSGDRPLAEVASFVRDTGATHLWSLVLALVTLAFLLLLRHWFPHLPGPLLAVLLASAATAIFDLTDSGIAVVGEVPSGLPAPSLPPLDSFTALLLPALAVLLVGYTDNVLTARAFAARGKYEIDANQEFLALGAANIGAGIFRGFPVSSSGSRTAIGDAAGSRTQLHSLVALLTVVLVLLFLRPVLESFPLASLGALVIYAAIRLIDIAGFRRLATFRRSELVLAVAALIGVLLFDILYGILLAIALSVGDLLRRVARPPDAVLGRVPGLAGMHNIDDYPAATTIPGLLVYRYDSPLFFANAQNLRRRAMLAVNRYRPVSWFVLNMEANVEVDITALDALEQLRAELADQGIIVALARVKQDLRAQLRASGLEQRIGPERLFPTLPTAVAAYESWRARQSAAEEGPLRNLE